MYICGDVRVAMGRGGWGGRGQGGGGREEPYLVTRHPRYADCLADLLGVTIHLRPTVGQVRPGQVMP